MVKSRFLSYENAVMILLSLAFVFVVFDRLALNFLAPFVVPKLNLTNTQLGALAASLGLTWAVSGYVARSADLIFCVLGNFRLGKLVPDAPRRAHDHGDC